MSVTRPSRTFRFAVSANTSLVRDMPRPAPSKYSEPLRKNVRRLPLAGVCVEKCHCSAFLTTNRIESHGMKKSTITMIL